MSMTMVVTRDAPERFRGFLAGILLEVAPATYVGPRISPAVRERLWEVLSDWHRFESQCGVVMVWADNKATAGIGVATLGTPPTVFVEHDGLFLAHHPLTAAEEARQRRHVL